MGNYASVTKKILKDIDFKAFDELRRRISSGKHVVRVGVPTGPEQGGTPLTMIAAVHEFGSGDGRIPERPFLRVAIEKSRMKYIRLNRINLVKMLRGQMVLEQALGQLGEMAKGDVQTEIRTGNFKPLEPTTIAARRRARGDGYNQDLDRKVSKKQKSGASAGAIDRPLIDTGQMVQSITWEIK